MQTVQFANEIEICLMTENMPSQKLKSLIQQAWFAELPFSVLLRQVDTEQSRVYHPEGSVWNHTLLVVDEAAQRKQYSESPDVFMWSALLHDIGKPDTTKIRKGRITAYNHDNAGAKLAYSFLLKAGRTAELAEKAMWLVKYHMQPLYVLKSLPFQDIKGMKQHTRVQEVALLSFCDRLGRLGADREAEMANIVRFLEHCKERTDVPWLKQG